MSPQQSTSSAPSAIHRLKLYRIMLGAKGQAWLWIGVAAGGLVVGAEFLVSLQIARLLFMLGLQPGADRLPSYFYWLPESPAMLALSFVLTGALRALLFFTMAHTTNIIYEIVNTRLRLLAFYDAFLRPGGFRSLTDLNVRVGDHFLKATNYCSAATTLAPNALQLGLTLCIMFATAPEPTGVGIGFILVVGGLVHLIQRRVRALTATFPRQHEDIIRRMNRMAKNWFLLKSLRTLGREHDQLFTSTLHYGSNVVRATLLSNLSAVLPAFMGILVITAIIFLQATFRWVDTLVFLSFLYLFMRLVQGLGNLVTVIGQLNTYYPAFALISDYAASFPEAELRKAIKQDFSLSARGSLARLKSLSASLAPKDGETTAARGSAPSLEFRDVSFRYDDTSPWVLDKISFRVDSGAQFAILGRSGTGKSTILALAMGVLPPTRGQVLIQGRSPDEYFLQYPADIAYVGAEPFLIEGSVRENLLYGGFPQDDTSLVRCLEMAQLGDWYRGHGAGALDYKITEAGEGLSTGQKQRLMLARAFARQPSLLVLDEVSANLDEKTEHEISTILEQLKGKCTTLVVTHRPGLVRASDARLTLE